MNEVGGLFRLRLRIGPRCVLEVLGWPVALLTPVEDTKGSRLVQIIAIQDSLVLVPEDTVANLTLTVASWLCVGSGHRLVPGG